MDIESRDQMACESRVESEMSSDRIGKSKTKNVVNLFIYNLYITNFAYKQC